MTQIKKSFYPNEKVENMLSEVPRGQISERINELLLKGLSLERQLKMEEDYKQFNNLVAQSRPRNAANEGLSTTMMMSARAFEPEDDEAEGFF